jgi:hypothetical protein
MYILSCTTRCCVVIWDGGPYSIDIAYHMTFLLYWTWNYWEESTGDEPALCSECPVTDARKVPQNEKLNEYEIHRRQPFYWVLYMKLYLAPVVILLVTSFVVLAASLQTDIRCQNQEQVCSNRGTFASSGYKGARRLIDWFNRKDVRSCRKVRWPDDICQEQRTRFHRYKHSRQWLLDRWSKWRWNRYFILDVHVRGLWLQSLGGHG